MVAITVHLTVSIYRLHTFALRPAALARRAGVLLGAWFVVGGGAVLLPAASTPTLPPAASAPLGAQTISVPVLLVDGHPVITATLYNAQGIKDRVTLELALDDPRGLVLDSDQFDWLALPPRRPGDPATAVEFSFGDGERVAIAAEEVAPEFDPSAIRRHNLTTLRFAADLQERKLKGRIGLGALRHHRVHLDLGAGELRLTPAAVGDGPAEGEFVAHFDLSAGQLAVALRTGEADRVHAVIGSTEPESRIAPAWAQAKGKPLGDLEPLTLDTAPALDLAQRFAFRPKTWRQPRALATTHPVVLTGIELLRTHRLLIDWASATLSLTATRPATPAADHRRFFAAEFAGTPEAYATFLHDFPPSRFAADAARALLDLRLAQRPLDAPAILASLRLLAETAAPEIRTEICYGVVLTLDQTDHLDLLIAAAQLGLEYSGAAARIQDIYRLHRVLGIAYERKGDLDSAWRHLLSASYVKADQDQQHTFLCWLHLGRIYEKQGRLGRAYSRYKAAAALDVKLPNLQQEARDALQRLAPQLPAEQLRELNDL